MDQGDAVNAQFAAGGGPFAVDTSEPGRDSAMVGAGFLMEWTPALNMTFDYNGQLGRTHFYAHTFHGNIRYRF